MRGGPRTTTGAFRNRSALAQHELYFGPNMTPMVDVVMVILVFFMAATAFVGPEWLLDAQVAQSEPEPALGAGDEPGERLLLPAARLPIVVRVEDGRTVVDWTYAQALSVPAFAAAIEDEAPGLIEGVEPDAQPILELAPAGDVPYQDVVRVHEACTKAGFERVGLR